MKDHLNVVVTGNVDSGKSTFIGRFLYESGSLAKGTIEEIRQVCQRLGSDFEFAYLLDSFEEERKGQLTIDTTQVFCKSRQGKSLVFIDVPGHQELLKNMLSGSSYADLAVLIVDVNKPIEDQTKRHAFILNFLGIKRIDVAINKMDSVNFDEGAFRAARNGISGIFQKIGASPSYFIPVSAKEGYNIYKRSDRMPWYDGPSVAEVLDLGTAEKREAYFRFIVQDIYNLNGQKFAVGDVASGEIKRGEKTTIMPLEKECVVRAIRAFDKTVRSVQAPAGIGLVLDKMDEIDRGQVICKPVLPTLKKEIRAKVFCINDMRSAENLTLKCGVQDYPVNFSQIIGVWDSANLEPKNTRDILKQTDIAETVITSDKPFVVEKYEELNKLGRFILKNAAREICAVGIVL